MKKKEKKNRINCTCLKSTADTSISKKECDCMCTRMPSSHKVRLPLNLSCRHTLQNKISSVAAEISSANLRISLNYESKFCKG